MRLFFSKNKKDSLKLDDSYTSLCIEDVAIKDARGFSEDEQDFVKLDVIFKKVNFLMCFFVFSLFILAARIWELQILNGQYYSSISEGNRIRIHYLKPRRGVILDRNGKQLVSNVPSFSLKIIQSDLPKDDIERKKIIEEIAGFISEDANSIENLLETKKVYYYQPIIVKENIDYEEALALYVRSIDMPGVVLEEVSKRAYIADDNVNSISHILGYDGKISEKELETKKEGEYLLDDHIGKTGIEASFEDVLRGSLGKSQVETNALGKQIRILAQNDPIAGSDLTLSVDYDLQVFIENLVKEELEKIDKEKVAVAVLDPRNGEVISLVNVPSFDNNLFSYGISNEDYNKLLNDKNNPLFNRAISGEYPPGSTFKQIMSAAGLEEGVITENTRTQSVGGIWVGSWFFPDWLAGGHGSVNVKGAVANSVNTFFYYVGGGYKDFEGLGVERISRYAKLFNLGSPAGIDLPGERGGFVPDEIWKEERFDEPWYIGDTYHLSIGQGYLLVTPLQVALYTSFFANGGTLYKPKIVKSYTVNNMEEIIPPEYLKKDIIKKENVDIVRGGLRDAVIYGSARSLATLPFSSAGKTGTAQTSNDKEPHAWFTCFAPFEDSEIVVTVLVEEGGEGSSVAAPIAKKILEYYWKKRIR